MSWNKKTHEQFVEELEAKNNKVKVIGEYNGACARINVECIICGHVWSALPGNLLRGKACPKCAIKKNSQSRRLTHEEYVERLKDLNIEIVPIDYYQTANTKIKHYCPKHNIEWFATPANIMNGQGCYLCGIEKMPQCQSLTQEKFLNRIKEKEELIKATPLENYVNAKTPIMFRCMECNTVWKAYPYNILKGQGCPNCELERRRQPRKITTDSYKSDLIKYNTKIEVLEPCKNLDDKILHKCLECNYEWYMPPERIYYSENKTRLCPCCFPLSPKEKIIIDLLRSWNMSIEVQKKYDGLVGVNGRQLSYDVFVPEKNILIEYNGRQHRKPVMMFGGQKTFEVQQEHDKRKKEYANDNNIKLLIIWDNDKEDIETILRKHIFN